MEMMEDDDQWVENVYSEAENYCLMNGINTESMSHDDLYQCAVSVAAVYDYSEDDVLVQLEDYFGCYE